MLHDVLHESTAATSQTTGVGIKSYTSAVKRDVKCPYQLFLLLSGLMVVMYIHAHYLILVATEALCTKTG